METPLSKNSVKSLSLSLSQLTYLKCFMTSATTIYSVVDVVGGHESAQARLLVLMNNS